MVGYKSDISNKGFQSRPLREIEVPDESGAVYAPEPPQDLDFEEINANMIARGLPPLNASTMKAMESQRSMTTESIKDIEARVKEVKRQKATGKERLSEAAKRRIQQLCGFEKNKKTIDLDGDVYELRTLRGKEIQDALVAASVFDGTIDLPFETRRQLLARSLVKMGGVDVELFLGDDSLEARLESLEVMDDLVLGILYDSYLQLVKEVKDRYAIKSDADAQEVLADLKK